MENPIDRPKSEMEVIMVEVKDIANTFAQRDIEINKINADNNKELTLKGMSYKYKEALITYGIVIAIAIIGGISGIAMLLVGKTEIGSPIILSTITAVLGFLGGKSLSK